MKNQRNKTLKLLIYVLLLAIVTSIIISGTFARYTSKTTVDSNAHIAAWNFKVNGFDKVAFVRTNLTDTIAEEKIAPGTEGKLELELNAEGCEVAVKYEIEISKLQDSPEVLKFYKDSDYTIEHPSKKVGEKAVYTINGVMPYSEIIKKPTKDVAIYWKWEYETESGDEIDTNIGTSAEDMEYEIKIKATQANEITQEEAETNIVYDYWTNGGNSADKTEEALEFNADVDLTPKAYKEGYEFIGWNTDSSATTGLTELKMTQQRVTLYAIYEKTITANLHYYNNQTKTITGSLYNKNTKATVSELGIEEITGYELRGISTSEQANAEIISTENGEIEITENEEYYASYTYNVTISFDSNGGQQDIEDITEKAYMNYQGTKIGANITMPTNEETADGYTFISWNETATDEEIGYIEGETYEFEESKTLYKNWSGLGIYAALYSDGTLEFNDKSVRTGSLQASTFATRSARTLVDEWNITDKTFDDGESPWYEHRENITTVNFANKIAPTSTANWFEECKNLTTIENIENLDTSNVTTMYSMFYNCNSLISLNLNSFNTSNVTNMNAMFNSCNSLNYLDLSSFDTSNVTTMNTMFSNATSLTTILVGEKWQTASDNSAMFRNCGTGHVTYKGIYAKYADGVLSFEKVDAINEALTLGENAWYLSMTDEYTSNTQVPWYSVRNNITTVRFNTTVAPTSTANWFNCCGNLTIIENIEKLDTSNVIDMKAMFLFCSNLKHLDLSTFNTSNVTNMEGMFCGCTTLTNLDLSSFNTSNVTNMNSMFGLCNSLINLDLSSFDTSNVTNMNSMFSSSTNLTTILVGENWQTAETNDNMFSSCGTNHVTYKGIYAKYADGVLSFEKVDAINEALTLGENSWYVSMSAEYTDATQVPWYSVRNNVTTVKFNTTVAPISTAYWFYDCYNLTEIDSIEMLDTSNVTNMSYMFGECYELTSLNLSSFDTSKVTTMRGMFSNTENLTSLDLSSFDTSNVTDMQYMFRGSKKLTTILVGENWKTAETNDSMFKNCGTNHVTNKGIYAKYADGVLSFEKIDTLDEALTLGENAWYVSMIDEYTDATQVPWHSVKNNITTVRFNTKVAPTSTAYWFASCCKLTTIENIGRLDTSNVTNMYRMFYCCDELRTLDLSTFNTSKVTNMRAMFLECYELTSLNLSSFDTSNVTSMRSMFSECNKLTNLDLSSFNTTNVTDMGSMFWYSDSLVNLDLSSFDTSNVTNMKTMFEGCTNLTRILVGENWKTAETNTDMFTGCGTDHVTQVNVGEMLTEAKVATFKTLYLQKTNMSKMAQV